MEHEYLEHECRKSPRFAESAPYGSAMHSVWRAKRRTKRRACPGSLPRSPILLLKRKAIGAVLLAGTLALPALAAAEIAFSEFSGAINLESRWYPDTALHPSQRDHASGFFLEPEFYIEDTQGRSITIKPFFRLDAADSRRTHADLREAYLMLYGDAGDNGWELRLGFDRVFWGVLEAQRLVDIINQVDAVEHPGGDERLGQFMAHFTLSGDWGILELFGLPGHRPRTFPGRHGRLRLPFLLEEDNVQYESSAGRWHTDLAARYSQNFGALDLGLSVFDGTSREPRGVPEFGSDGKLKFLQYYEQIRQFGLDMQFTLGPWLLKAEAIQRSGAANLLGVEENYLAFSTGVEYALYSLFDSAADLTLISEWHYDDRGDYATPARSPGVFENELAVAAQLALNDVQDTRVSLSLIMDVGGRNTNAMALLLERRLSDHWSLDAEVAAVLEIDERDIHYYTRRDSFAAISLRYNF